MPIRSKVHLNEWSVRLHLAAIGFAILVPLTLLGGYLAFQYAENERARYGEVAQRLAADILAELDSELDSNIAALQGLSTSRALRNGDLQTFDQQARELLRHRGSDIAMRDPTGQQIINTHVPWGTPLPISTHPVVRRTDQLAFETGNPVVSDLYQGAVAKTLFVLVDVPVETANGAKYALNIAMTPERIAKLLQARNLPEDWIVAVVDGNDQIIARSRDHERFVGIKTSLTARSNADPQSGLWRGPNAEGVQVLAASKYSRLSKWRVTAQVPTNVLNAPLRRSLLAVAGLSFLGLSLSMILAALYGGRIARALQDLCISAQALGQGGDVKSVQTGIREVNQIGKALAEASAELHERDVERSEAARRQQLLIHELNHRVKNTLATVQSIAFQTARTASSHKAYHDTLQGRLLALSRAHNLLNDVSWEEVALYDLIDAVLSPYAIVPGNVRIEGPAIDLSPKASIAFALVLHELATNAAKYGALSVPEGHLSVIWHLSDLPDANTFHLRWREAGGPPVQSPPQEGFGSRLIRRSIEHELNGTCHIDFDPDGLEFRAEISLQALRNSPVENVNAFAGGTKDLQAHWQGGATYHNA